jgi:hypothetical protein
MRRAPYARRLAEALAVALFFAPATACILVVKDDPDKLDKRCHFAGDDTTACGVCIAASCQDKVDACCGSKSCRDDSLFSLTKPLDLLDQCATGSASSCKVPSLSGASSTEGVMFTCIQSSCGAECAVESDGGASVDGSKRDGSSTTSRTRCTSSSGRCDCYGDPPFNDTPCDTAAPANSLCCASIGWPAHGLHCSCDRWECKETASGCECGASTTGPTTTCTGLHCCSAYSTCTCGDTPCDSYQTEVSSCSVENQRCSSKNDLSVSSCAR